MRTLTAVCLLLVAVNLFGRFAPKAVSPRHIEIGKQDTLVLMKDSKVLFDVVVPRTANRKLQEAGKEFADLLSRVTGQAVAVRNAIRPGRLALIVGDVELSRSLGIDVTELDRDGFVIRSLKDGILLIGSEAVDRHNGYGTLHAVYDFLERFADCRFYFPGEMGTLIPTKRGSWRVPEMSITDRPDNQDRRIYWQTCDPRKSGLPHWYDESDAYGATEHYRRQLRLSSNWIPNCHGLARLGLVERFAKTHPEYFALRKDGSRHDGSRVNYPSDRDGHICFSNPELKEIIYQDAKALLLGKSAKSRGIILPDGTCRWSLHRRPFFNVMPNDSMARCQCPGCREHFNAGKEAGAAFQWHWMLDIARRLQAEKVPGYVTMMAYDLCTMIPSEPIPDNVILQVALTGPWADLQTTIRNRDDQLLKDWCKKVGNKVYLWNYPTKCAAQYIPLIPNSTPEIVGGYYRRQAPHIFGAFFEAESDYWLYGHLNFLVFSKLMWDVNTDYQAILDEYYARMYGSAATPMKAFFQLLEQKWLKDVYGNTVDTAKGPVSRPPNDYQIWTEIFSSKVMKKVDGLFKESERLAADEPESLKRIRFMRKQMWCPMEEGARRYLSTAASVDKWTAHLPLLKKGERITVDGVAQEKAWATAETIELVPLGREEAEVHTQVKIAHDEHNFYFHFNCMEPEMKIMRVTPRKDGDQMVWSDNAIEIYLDPMCKRQDYYQLMVNSEGKLSDLRVVPDKLVDDWNWESGAQVATSKQDKGWQVEVSIPKSSLPTCTTGKVVANFTRHRVLQGKSVHPYYMWNIYGRTFGEVSTFGVLDTTKPPRNLFPDGDFKRAGTAKKPFPGEWFDWGGPLQRDTKVFRTQGACIRLSDKQADLVHRLPTLKPKTRYRLGFFLRMKDITPTGTSGGFYIRIDDGNGTVRYFPREAYRGTIPWMWLEYDYTTSDKLGTTYSPYMHFTVHKSTGTAWVDGVRLVELAK